MSRSLHLIRRGASTLIFRAPLGGHFDDHFIYLRISNQYDELGQRSRDGITVNIEFCTNNRNTYAVQHTAMRFIIDHELFDILINNPKYEMVHDEVPQIDVNKYIFHCSSVDTLNQEQRSAVINIVTMSHEIPFLLFGPPGE